MRSFSKKLAFVLAAAMVVTAFAPAASAKAADEMAINAQGKILYVTDGTGINDAAQVGGGKGNVAEYDFAVSNKPANWKTDYTFTWSSSNDKVVTVGKGGLTKAVAVGKAEVICTVTEKATGKAVTLKNTVTVKANAADVEITNPEVADVVYAVGETVDFNRAMYDADGNKTTKRGTYVTDYTKWCVDADANVVIDQTTGKYTFNAAGEYTVWCETYQSKKYNETIAASEKLVVVVEDDKTFEVKQDTIKKFTVKFDTKLASLGTVTVDRVFKSGKVEATFAAAVAKAELAKDGMSATVEMYSALADGTDYVINVEGFEPYTLTASQGAPVRMEIYVADDMIGADAELVAVTTEPATLKFRLYDANDVDVTDVMSSDASVFFASEKYSIDGSYYVSDNNIWFSKDLVEVKVIAQYNSGKWENGVQVGCFTEEKTFLSYVKEPVVIVGVADHKITGAFADGSAKKFVPLGQDATLAVKLAFSEGDAKEAVNGYITVDGVNYTISYESVTPNVAGLNGNKVIFFKKGTAQFVVYASYTGDNGVVKNAIGMVAVEAKDAVAFGNATLDKNNVVLSTIAPYNTAEFKVTAKNNYGADYTLTKELAVEGADQTAKDAAANKAVEVVGNVIKVDGTKLLANINKIANINKTTATLTYKVKVEAKQEIVFTVTVKTPDTEKTYLTIEADGFGGNIARTVDSKDAKVGSFTVYKMSNGVKAGVQSIAKYNKDAVSAGAYYFTVTKDGVDVTDKVDVTLVANGTVKVNFSTTEALTGSVTGSAVKYDLGAGSYVFTLYKGVPAGTKAVAVQQQSVSGTVSLATGSYGVAVKAAESVKSAADADIRAAFTVKDTKGNDAASKPYTVKAAAAGDYVFVESFTFYDEVATGVYATYVVPVGYALPIK